LSWKIDHLNMEVKAIDSPTGESRAGSDGKLPLAYRVVDEQPADARDENEGHSAAQKSKSFEEAFQKFSTRELLLGVVVKPGHIRGNVIVGRRGQDLE